MVLFKRKAVTIPPPKYTPEHPDQEVWFIPETLEYFCNYDDYLERLDFYFKPKFICELSGASCLTYFDARRREIQETENVLKRFPEPLKQPILAKIHMSTITRLDLLVDDLYGWLKDRYFIGEYVTVRFEDHRVRAEVVKADNGIYQVDDGKRILEGDASQLVRDRKVVSKLTLRAFVKHSAYREQWIGAPWIVRDDYVAKYQLPTEIPLEIQRLYKQRQEENAAALVADNGNGNGNASSHSGSNNNHRHRSRDASASADGKQFFFNDNDNDDDDNDDDDGDDDSNPEEMGHGDTESPIPSSADASSSQRLSRKRIIKVLETIPEMQNLGKDDLFALARMAADEPFDIFIQLRIKSSPWPRWHKDPRLETLESSGRVGHLIEVWLFSQYFSDLLGLKSDELLTFDAFTDALSSHDVPRPIAALHEAVLSCFVPEGKPDQVILMPSQADEDIAKRNKKAGRKSTKSIKIEDEEYGDGEAEDGDGDGDEANSNAGDNSDYGSDESDDDDAISDSDNSKRDEQSWADKIARREYADGGWQQLVCDILADLCYLREWHAETRAVVELLRPSPDINTPISAANAYAELPLIHRVHALMMLMRALYGSTVFREFIDSQYDSLMKLKKLPLSRELKQLREDLKSLERVISILRGVSTAVDTETVANKQSANSGQKKEGKANDKLPKNLKIDTEIQEGQDLSALEENEKVLRKQIEQKSTELAKINKSIARLDSQRMRFLGEDRFCNRYWWMDGNGVSTALSDTDFAMGKLCVQGPNTEYLDHCLNSQAYADEFVQYRKLVLIEAHKLREAHRKQLKRRREAKVEQEKKPARVPIAPKLSNSKSSTPARILPKSTLPQPILPRPGTSERRNTSPSKILQKRSAEPQGFSSRSHVEEDSSDLMILHSRSLNSSTQNNSIEANEKEINPTKSLNVSIARTPHHQSIHPVSSPSPPPLKSQAANELQNGEVPAHTDKDPQQLTDQQLRLKQAQDQMQMQAQIAARVQAHFDAEVQAQNDVRSGQVSRNSTSQNSQQQHSFTEPQPSIIAPEVYGQHQQQQPVQVFPMQDLVQWVVQQTAYGPMLYAVPLQQYQMLMQQYGMQTGMPSSTPSGTTDAYQAYLQQLAMQQAYMPQAYDYSQQYPQSQQLQQPLQAQQLQQLQQLQQMQQAQLHTLSQPASVHSSQQLPQEQHSEYQHEKQPGNVTTKEQYVPSPIVNTPPSVLPAPNTVGANLTDAKGSQTNPQQGESTPGEEKLKSSYLSQVMNSSNSRSLESLPNGTEKVKVEPSLEHKESRSELTDQISPSSRDNTVPPSYDYNDELIPHGSGIREGGMKSEDLEQTPETVIQVKSINAGNTNTEHNHPKSDNSTHSQMSRTSINEQVELHNNNKPEEFNSSEVLKESPLTPLDLLDLFEHKDALVSPNEWRFYETPEELDQLLEYLLESGTREAKLLEALRKSEKDIKRSMILRLQSLNQNVDIN